MRYVCSAAATVIALLTFAPAAVYGASALSITNYQMVSDQRATVTHWYVTFKADLVNTGPALPGITASVASRSSNVQVVPGQGVIHFGAVPANGRVTSVDTFTLLVDRSATFDWSQVEWFLSNPVAAAGPNQTARVASVVTLDGSGSSNPTGVGTLSYSWSFQSIPPGSAAVISRANTASPSFTVDAPGTYRCKLTVTNGSGSDAAIVTISTVNSPPVAVAGPNQTVPVGASVTLNGSKSSDVDGDSLTYVWSFVSLPAKSAAVLLGGGTVLPTFVADAPGTYIVQLVARDGKSDSQPSTVTISTANTPPVANAGNRQTVTAGMFVQLNGAASTDVDGDALTYRWSFNSIPPGSTAILSNSAAVNPTFTADTAGSYIVQLIVNDGKVDSAASTVTITTNAVQAPLAHAGSDVTVHAGTAVQLVGSGTDPQGFTLTYKWSLPTRPTNSTASLSATNIPNPTFVADLPGIYAAQVVVSNGVLSSQPATITITTTNTAPVADPGPPQSVYTGDTVYLDGGRSSDADNDLLTAFHWTFTSKPTGSSAVLSGPTTKTPTFVADVAGPYVVQLIVTDQFTSSQAKTVLINVGTRTISFNPASLHLYNSPGTLNISLSPAPTSPVSVSLTAGTPGVVSFSPNPATVPAGSSGVNVTVTPTSPGTTSVTASAPGYFASAGTITVTKPTISIALNGGAAAVGLTHKAGGSVTLNAPAPPGGTVVTLSSDPAPDGAVSFDSGSITIPEGGTTGVFSITGSRAGTANMNAAASGYNSGRQTVEVVMLGSVSVPSGVTVASGQSAPLNVQISSPAPSDGVTVALVSSDPGKLTISPPNVVIKPGATAPDSPPQLNAAALAVGEATVTATAGGFFSDQQTIRVVASVTFKDQAVSVGPGGVKSFTILLSAPAPAGGLLVYLSSSDESVATVAAAGALIPAGQQSVDSQVWGVSAGTADITLGTNPSLPGHQFFSGAGAVLRVSVARPAIRISTESLPAGIAGENYAATSLSATGGTGLGYFWTIPVGSLPSGLNLSTSGVISGSLASLATSSTFTVQVQDSGGNKDTKTFTISVSSPLRILTESLPSGLAGTPYTSTTLSAAGGSGSGYSWSIASGALPSGLTLSAAGVVSGTLSASAATSTFTVQVQDGGGATSSKQFTLPVNAVLNITTASLPTGTAGASYGPATLAASGGAGGGYTWSLTVGSLPSGLILSTAGVISGSLSASATTTTFTVQVKDSGNNTATKQFTLNCNAALIITTASLPNGTTGAEYVSTTLAASGGTGTGYSWSVSAGSLPSGLTLSTAGVLSGTLAPSATTSTFTIQVEDSAGSTASKQFVITLYPALTITTASLPAGTAGGSYAPRFLAASGGSGTGFSWSISAGSLPGDLTLSSAGILSGTLSPAATTSTFTIEVRDSANNTGSKQFTVTVNPALEITTASLPAATGGAAYPSTTLAASGGSGTGRTWSVSVGSLPSGLGISPAGVLSGTPAGNATNSTFTLQVQDDAGNKATKQFTIVVTLTVTTASLPAGNAGKSYSVLLAAAGGTGAGYAWSVSDGSLPPNVTLSSSGVISGTLSSSATTSTFTVQVQDSGAATATKQFTITVNPALSITTASLPVGTAGVAYPSTTLAAAGGSNTGYNWSVSVGSLPSGLSLSAAGVISGTLGSSAAASTFTVQVQDSAGNIAVKQFTIAVETVLTVATATLPNASVGAVYPATTLAAGGGTGTGYTWSITVGSLPAGLTLSSAGVLSGTPSSSAATSTFTVQVQDSGSHTATKQFTIVVNPALTITTPSLPAGAAGSAYASTTLAASGGSGTGYTWSVTVGTLPSGLTLSAAGVLAGTLSSTAATATVTIRVQDSEGSSATKQFVITVHPQLSITTASLPVGTASTSYPQTTLAATGGTGAGQAWSVSTGSLPTGLSLSAGGVISGTLASSATTSTFTVQVQDSGSNTASKQFILTVNPALTITTASLPGGIAGNAYPSTTLAASGGTGTGYAWSVSSGSLPSGLSLSTGGVISGTLSGSAVGSNVTIQVQDSGGNTATQAFSIGVNPALSVTTASLPDGVAGTAYTPTTLAATGGTGTNYSWSVSIGTLPSGLTLSPAGLLSGTLSASAATATVTIQVKDSGNNTAVKQFTITVASGLGVFTALLPDGIAGTAYGPTTLSATGGTGTGYTWSVLTGSLPSSLTLSTAGVLSGTLSPTATTSTFTIQVQDSGNNKATRQFTLTVKPALSIAATSLPAGTAESAYPSTTLSASGGTGSGYSWSVSSGSLPAGLTLSAAGVISGTLSAAAATSTFTVQVVDSGSNTANRQFTITVNPAVQITTALLPAGTAGNAYPATTLTASGGTGSGYTWSVSAGSLPAGLALSTGGVLSGTPLSSATTSTFTIQAQDSAGNTGRKQFTLTVTLVVTTGSLPGGTAGAPYAGATLTATGGTGAGYTWSVTAGSLPVGLSLSTAGVISGSLLATAASSTFTVQVQDSGGGTATKQLTITVGAALTINTDVLPTGTAGTAYPATTLSASGGSGSGYTWSVTLGSLPAGLTLSAAGVLSGTLSTSATTSTFTIQVKDGSNTTTTKPFTITVNPVLAITAASLPTGTAGSLYPSTTLAASGGSGTGYSWSVTVGSLPSGLTLNGAGVVAGTLSAAATSATFTVQVQDSAGATATRQFTITVNPALSITTPSLPNGTAGTVYPSTTLAATGGSGTGYTWSVTVGSLPPNLALSAGGVLSGSLSSSATSATFTVRVQDSAGNAVTKPFTVTVNPALSITTTSLPTGTAGSAYPSTTLAATGGTGTGYTWSVTAGSLPSGLTLTSAGVLSGTLSTLAASATFTVQVQDSAGAIATKVFSLTVNPALVITTPSLPNGTMGVVYPSTTLAATGGTGTGRTWSVTVGSLPAGLTLSAAGVISGTVDIAATTSSFTIQVQDSGGNTATKQFTIAVSPVLSITTASLPSGITGALYPSTQLESIGGSGGGYTYSVTVGSLPTGLILSGAGVISGTLSTSATTSTFTVQVRDGAGTTATRPFTLTVYQPVTIGAGPLPVGVAGAVYAGATLVAAGGTGTGYTWSVTVGSLPAGLTLSTTGVLSGTLSASAATSTFTVQAKDSANNTGTRQFTLTVNAALTVTTPSLPNGVVGAAYPSTTLAASGGTAAGYAWSVTGGSLPPGLTLSSAGVLSGTPAGPAATSTFTVTVQDSGSHTAAKEFTITVLPALVITTGSLPGGTAGTTYTSTTLAATGGTNSGYTWSVSAGALPSALSLSSAGVISGTLSLASVSATFTVQVKDSGNNTATKQFTIAVASAPLAFMTGSVLPNAIVNTSYNTPITVVGGKAPLTWSASGLPAWLTLDTTGFACGGVGNICGTPTVVSAVSFTITVTDTTTPTPQSISRQFNFNVTGAGGVGTISVPSVSVGVNLQAAVTVAFSPPPSTVTVVTVTSGNPGALLLGTLLDAGQASVNVTLAPGTNSITLFAKALSAASPVTVSATADVGYTGGSGSVTITNSGFLLAGPNGTGSDFTTFQGVTTGLTVYPYRLGAGNVPVENQSIRGGLVVNAPIGVSPSSMGTMGSPSVAISGGDLSAVSLFTASFINTGTASITITPPAGFTNPATGGTLNVSIQTSGFIPPSGVTVGRNLQAALSVALNGPAGANTVVTIQSLDATNLKFATSLTGAGSASIQVTINKGFASTPVFYARGYGSSGSVQYTISAATYGTVTTAIPLGPSGFVIGSPTGQGTDFSVTLGGPDPTLDLVTALFNSGGSPVAIQPVSPDVSVTAALTSFTPSVGTVNPSLLQVLGGTSSRSFTFHAASLGSTNITATASGYTSASVKATVTGVSVFLNPVGSVGRFLAAPGLVNLSSPAITNLPVTVTVTSGPIQLAVNKTDAGSNSITVTVPPGSTNAAFWVYGTASSGAGTYTASVAGSSSAPDTVTLAPSGIAIYMGSPGNPSCFGTGGFACAISLAGGARTVYAVAYQLAADGTINGQQSLAGGVPLSVPLGNSSSGVGTVPSAVSIPGGASFGSFSFTPSATGSTVISANPLSGWSAPSAVGFDLSQLRIAVQ